MDLISICFITQPYFFLMSIWPCVPVFFVVVFFCLKQGDANRSYSDDDRSSFNLDETEKKDSLQLSGTELWNNWRSVIKTQLCIPVCFWTFWEILWFFIVVHSEQKTVFRGFRLLSKWSQTGVRVPPEVGGLISGGTRKKYLRDCYLLKFSFLLLLYSREVQKIYNVIIMWKAVLISTVCEKLTTALMRCWVCVVGILCVRLGAYLFKIIIFRTFVSNVDFWWDLYHMFMILFTILDQKKKTKKTC